MDNKILIEYDEKNRAKFIVNTSDDEQIVTAIMGLEKYMAAKSGLHVDDIRQIIDDMAKDKVVV